MSGWLRLFLAAWLLGSSTAVIPVQAASISQSSVYSLTIPKINLTATAFPTGLNAQNLQEVPVRDVGWYKLGTKPGQQGNVVLVGHTPGVFNRLVDLTAGDLIKLGTYTYQVTKTATLSVEGFPTKAIYGPSANSNLILITCRGTALRTVVYAGLLPNTY